MIKKFSHFNLFSTKALVFWIKKATLFYRKSTENAFDTRKQRIKSFRKKQLFAYF